MTLHDRPMPNSDQRAERSLDDLNPQQLEELRDSAIAYAGALLRRHRKLRELIVKIDQLMDATKRLQKSLWGRS